MSSKNNGTDFTVLLIMIFVCWIFFTIIKQQEKCATLGGEGIAFTCVKKEVIIEVPKETAP